MARHVLTRAQTPIVLDLLRAHARRDPSGRCVYDETWDDERVRLEAEAINPDKGKPIVLASVAAWRRDIFGRVRTSRADTDGRRKNVIEDLKAEIEALKQRLDLYQHWMQEHDAKITKMELHLRHRGGYVPPPGKQVSSPPNGTVNHG